MKNLGVAFAGGHGKREKDDFYPTPPEATRALLPLITDWPKVVWEPACGDGAIARVLEEAGCEVWGADLVDRGYGDGGADFFKCEMCVAETLITNPPFKLAAEWILHAQRIGVQQMALLLKMTFWNAATRNRVWKAWPPRSIHPLTWRLDFDGRGAPTMDCMWCLWGPYDPRQKMTTFYPLSRPAPVMSKTEIDLLA